MFTQGVRVYILITGRKQLYAQTKRKVEIRMKKNKYKGTFNVSGETSTEYTYAFNEMGARVNFRRRLSEKYGRQIFMDRIDHKITKVEGK